MSMPFLTLRQAKDSRISEVSQCSPESPEFLSLLNEATRRLMARGDWPGVVVPIFVCVKNGCVVWPRYVGKIRKINRCHQEVKVGNLWWDYVDRRGEDYNRLGFGSGTGIVNAGLNGCSQYRLSNQGWSATYSDIVNANRTVRAYCMVPEDAGKTIQLFGLDGNGQALRTHNSVAGTWVEGITLRLAVPYVETPAYVSKIDRVIKDVTQGDVLLYAWDAVNSVLEGLASYDPGETVPSYERDQIFLGNLCCTSSQSVSALVKLKYIPAKVDTDFVLISNVTALKFMVQAIKLEEAGDRQEARDCVADAVHELNLELNDEFPIEQTPVDTGFMGGARMGSQKMI